MTEIHDINTCISILRNDGHDVRGIKKNEDITINKGKIKFRKNSKFNPFNENILIFVFIMSVFTAFSTLGAFIDWYVPIILFFFGTLFGRYVIFDDDEIQDNKIMMIAIYIICFLILILISYRVAMSNMEHDASLFWMQNDKEFMEKYEKMKSVPHWMFYLK